jgi:lipopolysaccharide export system permease protein
LNRIDRYLLQEAWPPLLFGTLLYAGLAVISATLPRLQWMVGASGWELASWLLMLIPQALVQTVPIALVLAVLLTFGRLATEHELTAMQAGGVPIRRITGLFVAAGATLAMLALAANQWWVPAGNAAAADLYWRLTTERSGLFRLAAQRVPVEGFTLWFERVSADGALDNVRIERWDGQLYTLITAGSGRFEGTDLELLGHRTLRLDFAALDTPAESAEARFQALVRVDAKARNEGAPLVVSTGVDEAELVARFSGGGFEDARSLTRLWADAWDVSLGSAERREALVLGHRKLAEAVSNIALLLMALPLAIVFARSREISFGMALVVTLLWYILYVFGQLLALGGVLPAWLGPWSANILLGGGGLAWVLWRSRRG